MILAKGYLYMKLLISTYTMVIDQMPTALSEIPNIVFINHICKQKPTKQKRFGTSDQIQLSREKYKQLWCVQDDLGLISTSLKSNNVFLTTQSHLW